MSGSSRPRFRRASPSTEHQDHERYVREDDPNVDGVVLDGLRRLERQDREGKDGEDAAAHEHEHRPRQERARGGA